MLREWFGGGGGLDGYFGEQTMLVGIQECPGDFTDYAWTISAGSLFQNEIGQVVKAN